MRFIIKECSLESVLNDKWSCYFSQIYASRLHSISQYMIATRTFLNILPDSASPSYFYLESWNKTVSQKLNILSDLGVRCEVSSLQIIKNYQNNIGTVRSVVASGVRSSQFVRIAGNNLRNWNTETKTLLMILLTQPESSASNRDTKAMQCRL